MKNIQVPKDQVEPVVVQQQISGGGGGGGGGGGRTPSQLITM